VLQGGVGGQNGVVGLNHSSGDLRGRVNRELKLGLLAIVDREALHEKRSETGTGTTSKGVEDKETLKTSAVVSQLANTIEHKVNNFLSDGVVTTSVIVGGIFLSGDQLFGVEQLAVGTSTDFVNDGRFEIDENGTRDVFSSTSLREEGVERVIATSEGLVRGHLTIGLDTVFKAIEFPASITDLDTGLTDVD